MGLSSRRICTIEGVEGDMLVYRVDDKSTGQLDVRVVTHLMQIDVAELRRRVGEIIAIERDSSHRICTIKLV